MESWDILALRDASIVSSVEDNGHPTPLDAQFDRLVNQSMSFAPQASSKSSLPGEGNDAGELQSGSDFDSHFPKSTLDLNGAFSMTMPSFLNTSILSHFTTRPLTSANCGSIHHKLQRLRHERQKRHESTLNSTGLGNGKKDSVDETVEITDMSMTRQNGSEDVVGKAARDVSPEDAQNVAPDIPDLAEPGEVIVIDSDSKTNTPTPSHVTTNISPELDECQSSVACRGRRSARQTPKMAQLIQESSKLPRLEKAFKVTVELSDWIVKPLPDCRSVCVEGKRDGMLDFWHSTAITDVKTPRHVMTASGSEYRLKGRINELCTVDSGFTASVARAFKNGFPNNWKQVIKRFYATLEDSIPVEEEISFVGHFDVNKFAVKQERQKKSKLSKAPKMSSKDANQKKKFKSKGENATARLKSFSSEEDLDAVLTPVGLIKKSLATSNLTVTRSGRISLPPLARWSGQKYVLRNSEITVDFRTNDAKRAVMEETKAVFKLSKPHQKMMECQKSVGLSPSTATGRSPSVGSKTSKKNASRAGHKLPIKNIVLSDKSFSDKSSELESSRSEELGTRRSGRGKSLQKNGIRHHENNIRKKTSRRSSDANSSAKRKHKGRRSSGRLLLKKCIVIEKRNFTPRTVSRLCKETGVAKSGKDKSMTEITNTKHIKLRSSKALKEQKPEKATCKENALWRKRETKRRKKSAKNTSKDRTALGTIYEKNVMKKRKRSPSSSPPIDCNHGSGNEVDTSDISTPRSTNRNNQLKKRRISPPDEGTLEGLWSTLEKDCLQRAVRDVNNSSSDFWNEVASAVQTKTAEECQLFYTNYLEDKTGDKLNKSKGKSGHTSGRQKGDPVQGTKGTMKRKKEIRAFLDEQNEDYEDNLFEGTPFVRRKPASSLVNKIAFDKEDDEIFGANCNFFTPIPGRDKLLSPQSCLRVPFASAKKTPALVNNFVNSPLSAQRHCADKYIHNFMDKKKKSLTEAGSSAMNKEADLESSLLPKKSLFSPTRKASVFLEEDKELDELHDDDEEDNRYMYYWNDLDCSQ